MEHYFSKIFCVYLAAICRSSQTVIFLKRSVDVHGNKNDHKNLKAFWTFQIKNSQELRSAYTTVFFKKF